MRSRSRNLDHPHLLSSLKKSNDSWWKLLTVITIIDLIVWLKLTLFGLFKMRLCSHNLHHPLYQSSLKKFNDSQLKLLIVITIVNSIIWLILPMFSDTSVTLLVTSCASRPCPLFLISALSLNVFLSLSLSFTLSFSLSVCLSLSLSFSFSLYLSLSFSLSVSFYLSKKIPAVPSFATKCLQLRLQVGDNTFII